MKTLRRWIVLFLLLAGCALARPGQEIAATFHTFLSSVRAGDQSKILAAAPFLSSLPRGEREAVIRAFGPLAQADPRTLVEKTRPGPGGTYLLEVSIQGRPGKMVIPFERDARGNWTMSPVLRELQHIDIVPGR